MLFFCAHPLNANRGKSIQMSAVKIFFFIFIFIKYRLPEEIAMPNATNFLPNLTKYDMLSGMESDKQAIERINEAIRDRLIQLAPEQGKITTAIEGVTINRVNENIVIDCFIEPRIALIVQGSKRVVAANKEYRYGEGWYIAYGIDLPAISHITGAAEKPHLALSIPLDRYIISQLAAEVRPVPGNKDYKGVTVAKVTAELLDAYLRLISLLDRPERIPVLAPMIIREIHYLLLTGPEGEDFRLLGISKTPNNQIARAVTWMREHYREPFSLAELAAQVNMSPTSLSRHFNRITGMSPLQFQKRLRLYEARRLMLTEDKSAETAAFTVGYESPTQFNREYKRQFGEPPYRDIERLLVVEAVTRGETGAASLTGA
jgi:AraC-like DNA-binding protein